MMSKWLFDYDHECAHDRVHVLKKGPFKKEESNRALQIHIFKEQKKLRGGYYTTAINFLDM